MCQARSTRNKYLGDLDWGFVDEIRYLVEICQIGGSLLLLFESKGIKLWSKSVKRHNPRYCPGITGLKIRFIQFIWDGIRSGERLLNLVCLFQEIFHFEVNVLRSHQLGGTGRFRRC